MSIIYRIFQLPELCWHKDQTFPVVSWCHSLQSLQMEKTFEEERQTTATATHIWIICAHIDPINCYSCHVDLHIISIQFVFTQWTTTWAKLHDLTITQLFFLSNLFKILCVFCPLKLCYSYQNAIHYYYVDGGIEDAIS